MDTPTRLKMKIGDHEFEAEGSADAVREQFQVWQELVKTAAVATPPPAKNANLDSDNQAASTPKQDPTTVDVNLQKIMRLDNRIVSLTARLGSVHDAVLVMLYGQKAMRNNEAVTGAELLDGLAATGGFAVSRLDRILDKLADDGDVMAFGERRGKRYRLTNTGIAKARAVANDTIAMVA
jgi:hypothetical protein